MPADTNDRIRLAYEALDEERAALAARARDVVAAMDALRPLLDAPTSRQAVGGRPTAPTPPLPTTTGATYRSPEIARITEAVVAALKQAGRPMTVRELAERLNLGKDSRQLADLLYRKQKANDTFIRLSDGLYGLREGGTSGSIESLL